ncbi:TIGR01777 family protein [Anopheles sinensis]|uniref:TIGR01777 family protein n=1 Tax=Anopheles sinensis TaxID=74873 RepID=A0A084VN83_ANOSI|nr:TIGR01777 family protein [Anopheles sinensis]
MLVRHGDGRNARTGERKTVHHSTWADGQGLHAGPGGAEMLVNIFRFSHKENPSSSCTEHTPARSPRLVCKHGPEIGDPPLVMDPAGRTRSTVRTLFFTLHATFPPEFPHRFFGD